MFTKAIASEVQDHKQQNQDDEDDHKHYHPTWGAPGRSAGRPNIGAGADGASGVRGGGLLSPVPVLLNRASEEECSHEGILLFIFLI
jgi:hypothetical protein